MADTESILQLGIEAARAGDKGEARELFRLVTREDPQNPQGWLWLAGVAEDRDEKRAALERVVELNPDNELARKGLAALGSPQPAPAAADAGAAATAAAAAQPAEAESIPGADADQPAPVAEQTQPSDDGAPPAPARGRARARSYESPAVVGAAAAATPDDAVTLDDDYDLQDYQQEPRPLVSDMDDEPRVVVEGEEEPRRRGAFAWLPLLLAIGALVLAGIFLWTRFRDRNPADNLAGTTGGAGIATTATAGGILGSAGATETAAGAVGAPGGATTAVVAIPNIVTPGDTATAAATGEQTASTPEAQATAAAPVAQETATVSMAQATAAAPAAQATAAPATAAQTAAPAAAAATAAPPSGATTAVAAAQTAAPAGQTTIVVVAPSATVVPPAAPQPTAAPAPPAQAPPPGPPDVAAANPAIVPNGTPVQAGKWTFTATNFKNVATGSYGGSPPTRGQYQIVVLFVANNTGQPATVPDGFFVIKDAQGRVYDFNRAASVDYLNRFGGAGVAADAGADTPLPSNNALTSVPFLFDVPRDATNLVLFSRDNLNQGFLVR